MNATVTRNASRSSHGSTGIPHMHHQAAAAVAKASKSHEESVKQVEALAANIVNAAKTQPGKLYRADQLAEETGLSISWVNLQLSKDKPQVMGTHGKSLYYSEDYLDLLKSRGAKPRQRRVQMIQRAVVSPVQKKVAQTKNVVNTLADIANQHEPLFERLARMEQEIKHTEEMLERISKFLGL